MLIGLCGGLCAGKKSVARYLVTTLNFTKIALPDDDASSPPSPPDPSILSFPDIPSLISHVTTNWRSRFVLSSIQSLSLLEELSIRPFFILVSIDAPVHVRWQRWKSHHPSLPPHSLESFVLASDRQMFDPSMGIVNVADRAAIKILNSDGSLSSLHLTLDTLDLANPERLRPSWDCYFMALASLAAKRSNCMKRRVGCVLVREKRVIATGYNGAPRGLTNCNEGGCGRCNSGVAGGMSLAACLCIHAEENALLEAGRERVGAGATLYCDTCPCLTCSIKIVQVGISEVVYSQGYSMDEQTAKVLGEGGVRLRQFSPPRDGLFTLT